MKVPEAQNNTRAWRQQFGSVKTALKFWKAGRNQVVERSIGYG